MIVSSLDLLVLRLQPHAGTPRGLDKNKLSTGIMSGVVHHKALNCCHRNVPRCAVTTQPLTMEMGLNPESDLRFPR